mgnify:CR=1 FL=1
MTLIDKLSDLIHSGYKITFNSESRNLVINLSKTINYIIHSKESWLPLHDHFYEGKIIECLNYMQEEIQKENTK